MTPALRKQTVWRRLPAYVLPIVLAALVWPTAPARADEHPGHGSKVVLGTLKDVTPVAIVVEVLDTGGGGTTRVRVQLQPDTRFRIDQGAADLARRHDRAARHRIGGLGG
jgi:hypothetical protein